MRMGDGDSGWPTVAFVENLVKRLRSPAIGLFHATFGTALHAAASAPGRVNLIGEHTDYNGGPVLPFAIKRRTVVAAGPAAPGMLELISTLDGVATRLDWREPLTPGWSAYIGGVMRELVAHELAPPDAGARIAVASDVPVGAGLASSAALTVAAARALARLYGAAPSGRRVAAVAYRAEHHHVGVRCGVMDPLAAALGRPGHALLIECATLAVREVPFRGEVLLVDTGVRHDLAGGALNERRVECEEAVRRLRVELPELQWLARWPAAWIDRLKRALPEPLRSRALHVVGETARARFAAELLERHRLADVGRLLFESHDSCRRLYECSAPELDTVVAAAKRAGALGARLTGAGWGGSALVLTRRTRGSRTRVAAAVRRAFVKAYGREPGLEWARAAAGARFERVR
jgi:galactokinase